MAPKKAPAEEGRKQERSLLSPLTKGIALSAFVFVIVSQAVHIAGSLLEMGYYTDPSYLHLWSPFMMPSAGPPGPEFFSLSILFSLATGLVFAWAYSVLRGSVPGAGARKGLNFGLMVFLLAGVPFTLTAYLLLAVPAPLLFAWAIESIVVYSLSGAGCAKLIR
jgi:hypothetical protein